MDNLAPMADWPAFGLQSDVRPAWRAASAGDEAVALVTLFAAEGPAPHGVGAQMLLGAGRAAGFLSGGCVEADVATHAAAVLAEGAPRRLVYGRGGPPDIQLLCGSRIEALVERVEAASPAGRRLLDLSAARRPALWMTDGRTQACLAEGEAPTSQPPALRFAFDRAVAEPGLSAAVGGAVFRRYDPAPRVVVAGGDPTALAIAALALQMGWEAVLIRAKGPSAPPPVAGLRYLRGDPALALADLGLDPWTVVAATSHDVETDTRALAPALRSQAAYVGALGSRRRVPERVAALRAVGVAEADIARLKAPIGLPIRAQSAWEIAVSVLAEAIAALKDDQARRRWPAP